MTEKRFSRMTNHYGTSRTYCTGVYDNQNNRELKNVNQVITELNALHEENEQLKQQIKKLEAQLYCNHNDGVCSICKHCYLEEQSYYYISKCEKGHEQCSKEDVKYCEDFEVKELQE